MRRGNRAAVKKTIERFKQRFDIDAVPFARRAEHVVFADGTARTAAQVKIGHNGRGIRMKIQNFIDRHVRMEALIARVASFPY